MTEPSDPTAPPTTPAPEVRRIAGRYRLGPVIGRGGMATIHQATDERLGREIAIKLLRPEVTADPDLAQRFRREALAATVLRHPNIVACLDTGTDGDQPFLVMDLIDGEDLAARLKRSGRLAPWQVARIGLDIARGIGVAHIRGIVHRDVKPANILLAADGRAMVTDFGIARLAADAEASMPGTTLGSVHYFSPEQARGATTTPASDVYGLGLVMFEALTGQRAWSGATTDAIALARVGATPPAPRGIRPEI
ncbi:MAG TPA: protein kinase, partial [Candidatus Saccharimonadales bacterium]|nr:protein kinase [Candidatus Saccharimonadales bacterium]